MLTPPGDAARKRIPFSQIVAPLVQVTEPFGITTSSPSLAEFMAAWTLELELLLAWILTPLARTGASREITYNMTVRGMPFFTVLSSLGVTD
jgi:hypothetical protein